MTINDHRPISEKICLGQVEKIALFLKNISQKSTAFAFGNKYLHQTFTECVSNQYTHIEMPDVTASYGTSSDFISFFNHFHTKLTSLHVCVYVSSPNFHNLCV